ncbi:MAG: tRNA (adenosine(37)-N6)-dimethylallyltransferase MiaA [Eggerthellaceae bacterium]|nr:tRNA (adenosine(37)-N6)-dimethylallyltransferase MiaA [Eggerthellaceae bacterium]
MSSRVPIICVVGPTASGKSDYSQKLAQKIDAEIISADSMQVYKGMDIGTSKVMPKQRKVKHWGLDLIVPDQTFSVALYQEYARYCAEEIWSRGKNVILCGGTGLYVRSVIDNFKFLKGELKDNSIRKHYNKILSEHGSRVVWEILREKDPNSAKIIHPNNSVRVVRALEMLESGKSYAKQAEKISEIKEFYSSIQIGINVDRDTLYKRINIRVDQMMKDGLLEEAKTLYDAGLGETLTAKAAIGYKELFEYFDNKLNLDEAVKKIKLRTRRYAKRQMTWFNRDKRIEWINLDS